MSKRLFNQKKPPLFKPKFSRGRKSDSFVTPPPGGKYVGIVGNSDSTSSFRYNPGRYLISAQQLPINYSKFENHTFFDSAVSKVNVGFNRIINEFPFDSTLRSIEAFEDSLTGYENHLFNSFPKNVGFLLFSGTQTGEDGANGTYLAVNDREGANFPSFSKNKTGQHVLDPNLNPFTFEMQIFVPSRTNDSQVIVQKRESLSKNVTIALSESASTTNCNLIFGLSSGSAYLFTSSSIKKGVFNYISAQFNRANNKLFLYLNDKLAVTSSTSYEMEAVKFDNVNLLIGSGAQVRLNEKIFTPKQTLSGAIDEFRFFHSTRLLPTLKKDRYNEIYASTDLKLYFKFNESSASYDLNNVALDSSGNSLHTRIQNFTLNLRNTGSYPVALSAENKERNPILFFGNPDVTNLNATLLTSGTEYDEFNPNLITKLIPQHYFLEGNLFEGLEKRDGDIYGTLSNSFEQKSLPGSGKIGNAQLLISFMLIWAKFFDELKLFLDSFANLLHVDYEEDDSVPDIFLKFLADYFDFELPAFFGNANLNQYVDKWGIFATRKERSQHTLKYIQNQMWRRMLTNVRSFQQSKGTVDTVKGLIRASGINPDELFTIREYGGQSQLTLSGSRTNRIKNIKLLQFSGSLANVTTALNAQGIPDNKPFLLGSFLSGSRTEVGTPQIKGSFTQKLIYPPHGLSNNVDDGLMTSGSFYYEGIYRFPTLLTSSYPLTQSLVRLATTGSSAPSTTHGIIFNMLAVSQSGGVPVVKLYGRPSYATTSEEKLFIEVASASIFDGDMWHISFGRARSGISISSVSSSYHLRVGKVGNKNVNFQYVTSSLFLEPSDGIQTNNVLQSKSATYNASGTFLLIGSQSLSTHASYFLNGTTIDEEARETTFAGEVSYMRYWSKFLDGGEWIEHVRNPESTGVKEPRVNYNFLLHNTGTFQRMRVNTLGNQGTSGSNSLGDIEIFDFSQNNLHFSGSGFEPSTAVMNSEKLIYTTLNPSFDMLGTNDKVRIRSLQNRDRFPGNPFATIAPVYNVPESEEVIDDKRFTIDLSVVKGMNEDIIKLFADLDYFDDALGAPNLLFAQNYPQVEQVRKNYFKNLTAKLDIKRYQNLFKWFDDSFTSLISSYIPAKTTFMGVNFVIESHMLERHKFKYNYDEIYLKALERNRERGSIFLSQFVGNIKKF